MSKTSEINEVAPIDIVDCVLYKLDAVKKRTSLSTASIYRLMEKNMFPRPLRIGSKSVRWTGKSLRAWLSGLESSNA